MPAAIASTLMTLAVVPFAAWTAMVTVADGAPDGFEDLAGFHFGRVPQEEAGAAFWFACGI